MKKFLISSIIFSILILTAGACAPAPTPTSEPSETPRPPANPAPTEAQPTAIPPTPTREASPTPEVSYKLVTDPTAENLAGVTPITPLDISTGSFADWSQKTCPAPNSPNVVFSSRRLPSTGAIVLSGVVNGNQALNLIQCTVAPLEKGIYGLPSDEKMYVVTETEKDANGIEIIFQFPIGQRGLDKIIKNGFFWPDRKGVSRISPSSIYNNDQKHQFISGSPVDIEAFYKAQGTSIAEVEMYIEAISANNGFENKLNIKDNASNVLDIKAFFKLHVIFGMYGIPIGTSN